MHAQFSPDVHWIAYTSDESGRNEVYVRPFSATGSDGGAIAEQKWTISKDGGHGPHWRSDGKELFYLAPDGHIMAVPVAASDASFQPGTPHALFQTPRGFAAWDVAVDGKRFLFAVPERETQTPFTVILNWTALLKK
jgi:Tol biopolymer transport system component